MNTDVTAMSDTDLIKMWNENADEYLGEPEVETIRDLASYQDEEYTGIATDKTDRQKAEATILWLMHGMTGEL